MKKKLLVGVAFLAVYSVSGQEVIATQGDSYSNGNGSIDYTIGEVVTDTGTDGSNDLTQGFHQTNWRFASLEDHAPEYEATIFPNPTSEILNISASSYEGVTYMLFNAEGKLVEQNILSGSTTKIQVSSLATGSYSILLKDSNNQFLKTFKLIKNQ
jgi:hypothetical protein